MRVLVIDEALPWPPDSGKRIRTAALLSRLAGEAEIRLAYPTAGDEPRALEAARAAGVEPWPVRRRPRPKRGPGFALDLARNLLLGVPYMVMAHRSRALGRAVARVLATRAVDLVHVEWTPLLANVPESCALPVVVSAHNLEADIWARYHAHEPRGLRRAYIGLQARKVARYEREAFARATAVTAVSPHDAERIRALVPGTPVTTVPNGVDVAAFRPDPDRPVDPERCVFVGALDWRPNQDAVRWLLEEIWPRVKGQRPAARLLVVGRRPPAWLAARVAAEPSAELLADAPDVRPAVRGAALSLVPLRIGGGSRLKICEALALGRPVVSTPVGAEGLELEGGLRLADGAEAFAAAVLDLLQHPQEARRLAARGREQVLARYDWDRIAPLQAALWRDLVAGRRSVGPAGG